METIRKKAIKLVLDRKEGKKKKTKNKKLPPKKKSRPGTQDNIC